MADAVVRLIDDGALRRRLAAAGIADIAAYDWTRSKDMLEEALSDD